MRSIGIPSLSTPVVPWLITSMTPMRQSSNVPRTPFITFVGWFLRPRHSLDAQIDAFSFLFSLGFSSWRCSYKCVWPNWLEVAMCRYICMQSEEALAHRSLPAMSWAVKAWRTHLDSSHLLPKALSALSWPEQGIDRPSSTPPSPTNLASPPFRWA